MAECTCNRCGKVKPHTREFFGTKSVLAGKYDKADYVTNGGTRMMYKPTGTCKECTSRAKSEAARARQSEARRLADIEFQMMTQRHVPDQSDEPVPVVELSEDEILKALRGS